MTFDHNTDSLSIATALCCKDDQ